MTALNEWTLQEAQAATDAALAADPPRASADPTLPLFQWAALQDIEASRAVIERGDGFALLGAVRKCANHDLAMPEWLAKQFIRRYDRVLNCRAEIWDEVFGKPYPKGTDINAMRKRRELGFAVWLEVQSILNQEPETTIDAGLFERVGERFKIGKSFADKLYYSGRSELVWREDPAASSLARLLQTSRDYILRKVCKYPYAPINRSIRNESTSARLHPRPRARAGT